MGLGDRAWVGLWLVQTRWAKWPPSALLGDSILSMKFYKTFHLMNCPKGQVLSIKQEHIGDSE